MNIELEGIKGVHACMHACRVHAMCVYILYTIYSTVTCTPFTP